jgi:hypothetical protein
MHADRANRAVLILFALLLIAGGVCTALAGFGAFGAANKYRHLFANPVSAYFGIQGAWLWLVVAVAAVLLAALALRWLIVLLFSTDRAGDIRLTGDRSTGRSTLAPAALTEAVCEEIETYPGVHSAKARIIGDPTSPDLVITATLEHSADLAALRRRIETNAVAHARQALDNPDLPVILDLTITDRQTREVS